MSHIPPKGQLDAGTISSLGEETFPNNRSDEQSFAWGNQEREPTSAVPVGIGSHVLDATCKANPANRLQTALPAWDSFPRRHDSWSLACSSVLFTDTINFYGITVLNVYDQSLLDSSLTSFFFFTKHNCVLSDQNLAVTPEELTCKFTLLLLTWISFQRTTNTSQNVNQLTWCQCSPHPRRNPPRMGQTDNELFYAGNSSPSFRLWSSI